MSRLAAGLWVQAYIMRLQIEMIPAYVLAHGDDTAGAILVKLNPLDGTAKVFQRIMSMDGSRPWDVLTEGPEPEVDALLERQRRSDPDIWVIEVESRAGRHMLDEPGLE
ncbi:MULTISPECIES: DUF1491 family protein [Aliiruegeria]|uniref:GTP-binding protein Era n=1 Tax=Aliiruegeria lutimaris TaxID=571298 RepID=A0A1G8XK10_9RHOB|nr:MULTISPECIES: DUF1491 family protein [Aliiruegeria]NDR55914.1 DUF1491 family protein [Pseudoruegeria sp. M32A2M]SDJ90776.1 hypothetical protein SAMN04488026_102662 [Aliiruegeria lutimaris]